MDFKLEVGGRSGRLQAVRFAATACGAAGLAWMAVANVAHDRPGLVLAAIGVAVALWALPRRWLRPVHRVGVLDVHVDGSALWRPSHADPASDFRPVGWFSALGVVWIEGETPNGRVRLLVGADRLAHAPRRSLERWLRWLDRGGGACNPRAETRSEAAGEAWWALKGRARTPDARPKGSR